MAGFKITPNPKRNPQIMGLKTKLDNLKITTCCPSCGSIRVGEKWPAHRISLEKSIFWCSNCGFGWQHPLPSQKEIRDYYERFTAYNIHGANEKEKSAIKRIRRINKLMPNRGHLLDIGSGLGYFLKIAQKDGWKVSGFEPQKSAALFCQDHLGINVYADSIQNLILESKTFDVVTLWDVWEHVHDPLQFLDQCMSLLSPGGLMAMAIPNASGLPAKIFKGQWRYVMKTHLNYFTLPYIHRIFSEKGLEIKQICHTIKIQSLLQGFASWLPFQVGTENIIRIGRRGSVEYDRPEQAKTEGQLEKSPALVNLFAFVRAICLEINLTPIPGSLGDLMELYCLKDLRE
ncbi:MAG: class I SAM-dependent methyltransferase [Desulfobacteraceae bacterium]|nr:class I SAM-dependent methyltransferase [Desulfobacteraceae bacterium]MBU4055414.1 class I SAM-dependent methyltransferase [Pseudomonadota bacterium]